MSDPISALKVPLNNSKLQTENNSAWQTINGLISQLQLLADRISSLESRVKTLETP